ncbi:MAG: hypothetical protein R3247_17325, partial [Rhodothermales bacterium]|nr:hypothetical protein [Rhodothermales bacterium]
MPDARFHAFAQAAEAIAATSKRTEKTDRAVDYLAPLADDDLRRAARYLAGRLFPLYDQRTVRIGHAALLTALAAAAGAEREALQARLVALGDPGDVAAEALAGTDASPLTLAAFEGWLADLATVRGTKQRTERLAAMLGGLGAVEAKYAVKLLAGDLRIGFKEGGVEAALAQMAAVPLNRVRRVNMLTGDLGEAALLARHGRLGEARMRLFHPIQFMLATAAEDDAEVARQMPGRFVVEDKFDGIRAQAHVGPDDGDPDRHGVVHGGTRVALFSRTLDAITPSFPDLVAPLAEAGRHAPSGLVLDGEIVPVGDEGIRPFQALQRRLGRKRVPAALLEEVPVAFVAFDVLFADGAVLLDAPYTTRRTPLERLPASPHVRVSDAQTMDDTDGLDAAFEAARARGNEGLMVKAPASTYRPGRRGRDWLKIKRALATLDVVVTAVEVGSGKR